MASNLRVDSIVPATGGSVSIGTATGGVTIPGDLGIAGVLTYEDVTNVDSVGVITARDGIRCTGIVTATAFHGDGSALTGVGASFGNSSVNSTGIGTFSALVSNTAFSHRNVVINGGMQIYQRGDVTGATSHTYGGPDRFRVARSGAGTFSQKSVGVTGAFGIQRALQIDCTTQSGSLAGGAFQIIQHKIEGFNSQRFEKGYPTAKQFALSFYAYSEKGGTYTVALEDANNSRYVSASYTVTASTWQKHEVIFPADTTGKLDNDNGESLAIEWWLAAGTNYSSGTFSTSWASSVTANKVHSSQVNMGESQNNNFYLANVQLEVGSVCTPFEWKSFTEDLTECQRYYRRWQATSGSFVGNGTPGLTRMTSGMYFEATSLASGGVLDGDDALVLRNLSPIMRQKPSVSINNVQLGTGETLHNSASTLQANQSSSDMLCLHIDNGGGMSAGDCAHLVLIDDTSYLIADAEL